VDLVAIGRGILELLDDAERLLAVKRGIEPVLQGDLLTFTHTKTSSSIGTGSGAALVQAVQVAGLFASPCRTLDNHSNRLRIAHA
jgi:hypothetical protein